MSAEGTTRLSTDKIFHTLQGEGPLLGTPSIFARLDRCDLRCKWGDTVCDAFYTSWDPKGARVNTAQLCTDLTNLMREKKCRHVVITGGEPTLQEEAVRSIASAVASVGGHSTIETNGTRYIRSPFIHLACLSPKLRSSTPVGTKYEEMHEKNRWNPQAIKDWMKGDYYFKIVIDREEDIREVQEMLAEVGQPLADPAHVLFMPQGITAEELWTRGRWVAEVCKELGCRFTPRLQIDLYGNTRGT